MRPSSSASIARPTIGSTRATSSSARCRSSPRGAPTLDAAGRPAGDVGRHTMSLALDDGLPPNPERPFVLVVADPEDAVAESDEADNTASFRKHVIGVVTHGGVQPEDWIYGPAWQLRMGRNLRAEGYDRVIAFNWVSESRTPGAAVKQVPRLLKAILFAASQFPASDPVDLHLIGHSEGTVINSLAALRLRDECAPVARGRLPEGHHARPARGEQRRRGPAIQRLQWTPRLVSPSCRSTASRRGRRTPRWSSPTTSTTRRSSISTPPSPRPRATEESTTSGARSRCMARPTTSTSRAPGSATRARSGSTTGIGSTSSPPWATAPPSPGRTPSPWHRPPRPSRRRIGVRTCRQAARPSFTGTAAPGATIRLIAVRVGSTELLPLGRTASGPDGNWDLTTRTLAPGRYRVKAMADVPVPPAQRLIPTRPDPHAADGMGRTPRRPARPSPGRDAFMIATALPGSGRRATRHRSSGSLGS